MTQAFPWGSHPIINSMQLYRMFLQTPIVPSLRLLNTISFLQCETNPMPLKEWSQLLWAICLAAELVHLGCFRNQYGMSYLIQTGSEAKGSIAWVKSFVSLSHVSPRMLENWKGENKSPVKNQHMLLWLGCLFLDTMDNTIFQRWEFLHLGLSFSYRTFLLIFPLLIQSLCKDCSKQSSALYCQHYPISHEVLYWT